MDRDRTKRLRQALDPVRLNQVYDIVGADSLRCIDALIETSGGRDGGERRLDQFWARTAVRTFFAAVEAINFELSAVVLRASDLGCVELDQSERAVLSEESYALDESGQAKSRPNFLQAERKLRFIFPVFARLFESQEQLNVGDAGWQKFLATVKVRHRITHPKSPEMLQLTLAEATTAMEAMAWYNQSIAALLRSSGASVADPTEGA